MASDVSSGCTVGVHDEKEEGEISLEDVSSSEEGHLGYGYGTRSSQCSNCLSTQHCASWCTASAKSYSRHQSKKDAAHGKENRHHVKESKYSETKYAPSTLQEKNDDLIPISSDSDMEIVGLADNSKQLVVRSKLKRTKKKSKKKKGNGPNLSLDDLVSPSSVDLLDCPGPPIKHDIVIKKENHLPRPHHRELSPVHKSRPRIVSRSPPKRHRSPPRMRSPSVHSRSPILRSPPRVRSPKRSYRSPVRNKGPQRIDSPASDTYVDMYGNVNELLKKVRHLDLQATINRNKDHASSLKEKLSNMMRGISDTNGNIPSNSTESEMNDADDEEDLALLRQKALETKQKRFHRSNEQIKTDSDVRSSVYNEETKYKKPDKYNVYSTSKTKTKSIIYNEDDHDEEDLELRMIALRSAVLKKHQNRVQRGVKSGRNKPYSSSRSESPFTQSFLDNIPIPGEELLNFASPPRTPVLDECLHTEDMDLDTDVEREKEKLPYSPTDKITSSIPVDTELLGVQPSDVSFININEVNRSPSFANSMHTDDEHKPLETKIIENKSYLTNTMCYRDAPNTPSYTLPNSNLSYSQPVETSKPSFAKGYVSHMSKSQFVDEPGMSSNSNQETPYSPTDTPIYDPELSQSFPIIQPPVSITSANNLPLMHLTPSYTSVSGSAMQYNLSTYPQVKENQTFSNVEIPSVHTNISSVTTPAMGSLSSSRSLTTINDLPNLSSSNDKSMNIGSTNIPPKVEETVAKEEPLYMQGVPEVTKDVNKIPTLVNRTLVPVPILRINKELQQQLPARKYETHVEPMFRSADMQPVNVDNDGTSNTLFKPMKLIPSSNKTQPVASASVAFDDSQHHADEISENTNSLPESEQPKPNIVPNLLHSANSANVTEDVLPTHKKKKRSRRKRQKSSSITPCEQNPVQADNVEDTNDVQASKENTTDDIKNEEMTEDVPMKEEASEEAEMDLENDTNNKNCEELVSSNIEADASKTPADSNLSEISEGKKVKEETSVLPSSNETQKDTEYSSNAETNVTVPSEATEKKTADDRRQSIDDDEEALRAILLASMGKRSKSSDSIASPTTSNSNSDGSARVSTTKAPETCPVTNINSPISDKSSVTSEVSNDMLTKAVSNTTTVIPSAASIVGRKRMSPVARSPAKKVMKVSIPASTKVVNNAKKYQNTIVQRRLNSQKVAALHSNAKATESKPLSKVKASSTDTQRIVINLQSDTESDSESERQKIKIPSSNTVSTEKQQTVINPLADFEKSVDQFLRDVRKKQESAAAAVKSTSSLQTSTKDTTPTTLQTETANSTKLHTPLAVRHLPASQQEEYRRLKQQIIERERLKLQRTVENSVSNQTSKSTAISTLTKALPSNVSNKEPTNSKVNQYKTTIPGNRINLPQSPRKPNIRNVPTSNTFVPNIYSKQNNSVSFQTKNMALSKTNVSTKLSNETVSTRNTIEDRKLGSTGVMANEKQRTVTENLTTQQNTLTKSSSGLKVLTIDELNHKYTPNTVKQDNTGQIAVNNKTTSEIAVVSKPEGFVEDNFDTKNINNPDFGENIKTTDETEYDSDASTVILGKEDLDMESKTSFDSSESTLPLSQYQAEISDSLTPSNALNNDEDSLSCKSSITDDVKGSIGETWKTIKSDVAKEVNSLLSLSRADQERYLMDTEHKLVMKRYTVLDDLADMSGNLRQWDMERDLQTSLVAEVKKLREQLKIAEERLQIHRNRVNSMGPKVMATREKINAGRHECFKLSNICSILGTRVMGQNYKVPEAGAQLLDSKLKEVANHSRQLSKKKVPFIDISDTYVPSTSSQNTSSPSVRACVIQTEELTEQQNNEQSAVVEHQNKEASTVEDALQTDFIEETIESAISVESISSETNTETNKSVQDPEHSISEADNNARPIQPESCSTPLTTVKNRDSQNYKKIEGDHNEQSKETTESSIPGPSTAMCNVEAGPSTAMCNVEAGPSTVMCNVEAEPLKQDTEHVKKVEPYVSILTHLKVPRNTNPNGVLCPYELMGTCSDGDCQFVHQSTHSQ